MKKSFHYVFFVFLILVLILPIFKNTLDRESESKTVITSIKINNESQIDYIFKDANKLNNIRQLIFNEDFYVNEANHSKLNRIVQKGYSLGMALDLSEKNKPYIQNITSLIIKYNIKDLYFISSDGGYDTDMAKELILFAKDNGITLCLFENSDQNGLIHERIFEYENFLNGISNRGLITYNDDVSSLSEKELSFRLLRSIIDRGIRYIVLDTDDTKDIAYYDKALESLNDQLLIKGYSLFDNANSKISIVDNSIMVFILVACFLIMLIIEFLRFFKLEPRTIGLIIVLSVLALTIFFIINKNTVMIASVLLITVLSPANWTIRLYNNQINFNNTAKYKNILAGVTLTLLYYILSGLVIWAAFSSYIFRIGFVSYKLAILSYVLPIFLILLYIYRSEKVNLKNLKATVKNIGLLLLTITIIYIYLSRSGNSSLIPATKPELYIRMLLEEKIPVRPRLKEFLFGYPSYFLLFHIDSKKYKSMYIYVLLITSLIGISILNTFCHGFTSVETSLIRAFAGFILGIAIGTVFYFTGKYIKTHI